MNFYIILLGWKETDLTMREFIQCICAFTGSFGFGIIFNIKGKLLFLGALGGAVAWLSYLVSALFFSSDISAYFIAAMTVSLYSECMAVFLKTPVSMYLVTSLIPLVPGGLIFYTMQELIQGHLRSAANRGVYTFEIAGAIAMGVLIMSFLVKIWRNGWRKYVKPASPHLFRKLH